MESIRSPDSHSFVLQETNNMAGVPGLTTEANPKWAEVQHPRDDAEEERISRTETASSVCVKRL